MPVHARRPTRSRTRLNSVVLAQVLLERGTATDIAADLNVLLSKTFDLQDQTKSLADSLAPYKNVDRPEAISKSRRLARFLLPRRSTTHRRKVSSSAPSHQPKMVLSPFKHLIALFQPRASKIPRGIDACPPSLSTQIPDSALLKDLTDALASLSVSEASTSQLPTQPPSPAVTTAAANVPVAQRRKRRTRKRSRTPPYDCPDPFPMVAAPTGHASERSSWMSVNSSAMSSGTGSSFTIPATPVSSHIPFADSSFTEGTFYLSPEGSVSLCVITDAEDDPDPFAKATVQVVRSPPPSPSKPSYQSRRHTASTPSPAPSSYLRPPRSPASSTRTSNRRSVAVGRHARKRSAGGSYSLPSSPARKPRSPRSDAPRRASRAELPFPSSSSPWEPISFS